MLKISNENKQNAIEFFNDVYPDEKYDDEVLNRLLQTLNTDLTELEEKLIIMKYGLGGENPKSYYELLKLGKYTREEIRQCIRRGFIKLLHPVRRNYILGVKS